VKASLVGASAWVPVSGGELCLGTWQGIFLCEFDGPRARELHLTFLRAA
jgi:secondary thiamine-phosphate synthase enzyme